MWQSVCSYFFLPPPRLVPAEAAPPRSEGPTFTMHKTKNTVERVISGLEIDESIDLHIQSWKIQPFAWGAISIFLVAGLAGLFGTGPLSTASLVQNGVRVQYQQFHRQGLILPISIFSREKSLEIAFPHSFLEVCRIESIVPAPFFSKNEGDVMIYRFTGPNCSFFFTPEKYGKQSLQMRINQRLYSLPILIYP